MPDGRATPDHVRWDGIEGRMLPAPPWAKEGMCIFRPIGGPFDVLVPITEVVDVEPEATRS